jgi:hypothetical protein
VNHSKNVTLAFDDASRQYGEIFRGKHKGKVFVTTHRMIFLSNDQRDNLLSFAVAFMYMKNLSVEQPMFGANYISGIAAAHPNGEFISMSLVRLGTGRLRSLFPQREEILNIYIYLADEQCWQGEKRTSSIL